MFDICDDPNSERSSGKLQSCELRAGCAEYNCPRSIKTASSNTFAYFHGIRCFRDVWPEIAGVLTAKEMARMDPLRRVQRWWERAETRMQAASLAGVVPNQAPMQRASAIRVQVVCDLLCHAVLEPPPTKHRDLELS